MTKPSIIKKPKANLEKTVPSLNKSSPTAKLKKGVNEIDEIFSGKKKKKISDQKWKSDARDGNEAGKLKLSKEKKKNKHSVDTDIPARPRKKTDDGLAIYAKEELGVNNANAGLTPLCPFDCDCCF